MWKAIAQPSTTKKIRMHYALGMNRVIWNNRYVQLLELTALRDCKIGHLKVMFPPVQAYKTILCCCDWVNTMGARNEHFNATQITASTTIGVLKKRVLRMNPVPSLTTYLKLSSRNNGSSRPLFTQRTFYFALRLPSISASIVGYNLNVEILFSKVNDHDHAQRYAQSRLTSWAGLANTATFEEHCECMSGFSTLKA